MLTIVEEKGFYHRGDAKSIANFSQTKMGMKFKPRTTNVLGDLSASVKLLATVLQRDTMAEQKEENFSLD